MSCIIQDECKDGSEAVLVYHSVERFCSDLSQVYFSIQLFVNLSYHRSAIFKSHFLIPYLSS